MDAVLSALYGLSTEKVRVNVIRSAAGGISENDVLLAVASDAIIIGFNTVVQAGARALAAQEGVELRSYEIIYALIEDVDKALKGLLEPVYREVVEGEATVRAVFPMGRTARIAGFYAGRGAGRQGLRHPRDARRGGPVRGRHIEPQALQERRPRGHQQQRGRDGPRRLQRLRGGRPCWRPTEPSKSAPARGPR